MPPAQIAISKASALVTNRVVAQKADKILVVQAGLFHTR